MSVSKAPVKTGGGDLLPVEGPLMLLPLRALRASSDSLGFLCLGTAYYTVSGTVDSGG